LRGWGTNGEKAAGMGKSIQKWGADVEDLLDCLPASLSTLNNTHSNDADAQDEDNTLP